MHQRNRVSVCLGHLRGRSVIHDGIPLLNVAVRCLGSSFRHASHRLDHTQWTTLKEKVMNSTSESLEISLLPTRRER